MVEKILEFGREKFDAILISLLFVLVLTFWRESGYNVEIKDLVVAFSSSLFTLLLSRRTSHPVDASTVSGDVTVGGSQPILNDAGTDPVE